MNNPFFTVIIPTFNRAHTLEKAIESVLSQSFQNYEIIIVNDGSSDETELILSKYHNENLSIFHTANQGVSAARNFAAKKAKGDWLAFLDSDDEWLEHKLKLQYDFIQENPNSVLVHGEEIWIRNSIRVNPMKKHAKGGGDQFLESLKLCAISPSVAVIKKEIFFELGMFRQDFPACEDYDLWLKLTSLYEVGFIEDYLVNKYGGHEDQLSAKYKAMDYWRVKSIDWILKNRELESYKREQAIKVLKKKAEILIKGYIKHNNVKDLPEIQNILNQYL